MNNMTNNRKSEGLMRNFLWAAFIFLLGQTHLCAETTDKDSAEVVNQEIYDPLESYNRFMFDVNWGIDKVLFRPISEVYGIVPSPLRKGVRNFLTNLKSPVTLVNDLLQLDGMKAGQTVVRTMINTTIGIGGLFDVATDMGLDYHGSDFGETLTGIGVPSGPYLIIPILGPTTPRDLTGLTADIIINPVNWVLWNNDLDWLWYTRDGVEMLDRRTEARGFTDEIEKAIDPYSRVRSLYWQTRVSTDEEDSPKPTESEFNDESF